MAETVLAEESLTNSSTVTSQYSTPVAAVVNPLIVLSGACANSNSVSTNKDRIAVIKVETNYDDAETLARMFEDDAIQDYSLTSNVNLTALSRLKTILTETETSDLPYSHFGIQFWYKGFKKDFQDELYPTSQNQVGHFLTAVGLSYNYSIVESFLLFGCNIRFAIGASEDLSNEEVAMRLVIGHELSPDPDTLIESLADTRKQFESATSDDVVAFRNALSTLQSSGVDINSAIPYLQTIESKIQPSSLGNSIEDLRLSLMGWYFGQAILNYELKTRFEVADWIRKNIHE